MDAMSAHRDQMMAALKKTCVPMLRGEGLVGSFPDCPAGLDQRVDFLNVQFAREGGLLLSEHRTDRAAGAFRTPLGPASR
jgi:hypothetical protein